MHQKIKRVFLIILDSVGIGALPDAELYGDTGSNTLKTCFDSGHLSLPCLERLGLFHIDGTPKIPRGEPIGSIARLAERSAGKDTTIGHWEIAGIVSGTPLPTYPDGFPQNVIREFSALTGREVLCNKPYSGTKVLEDYGEEHLKHGALIVYTSADSVFQIAAHEEIVPVEELYRYCKQARMLLQGKHGVGRVIARPFIGEPGAFRRTANRHDFSLDPPGVTMPDLLVQSGLDSISVGKIYDIFAGRGFTQSYRTKNNDQGMDTAIELAKNDFNGLCFINLVDFDMVYGHRNDVAGYTTALNRFDLRLAEFLPLMNRGDVLIISADHGCDPGTPSTDHSREYVPLLLYGEQIPSGKNLGTRQGFGDIAATVCDLFGLPADQLQGTSFWNQLK